MDKGLLNKMKSRLEKYTIDEEFDVSYYAKKAMKAIFDAKYPFFEED